MILLNDKSYRNFNNLSESVGSQKRLVVPVVGVKICQPFNYS
jgi:hypothetical protein